MFGQGRIGMGPHLGAQQRFGRRTDASATPHAGCRSHPASLAPALLPARCVWPPLATARRPARAASGRESRPDIASFCKHRILDSFYATRSSSTGATWLKTMSRVPSAVACSVRWPDGGHRLLPRRRRAAPNRQACAGAVCTRDAALPIDLELKAEDYSLRCANKATPRDVTMKNARVVRSELRSAAEPTAAGATRKAK